MRIRTANKKAARARHRQAAVEGFALHMWRCERARTKKHWDRIADSSFIRRQKRRMRERRRAL